MFNSGYKKETSYGHNNLKLQKLFDKSKKYETGHND